MDGKTGCKTVMQIEVCHYDAVSFFEIFFFLIWSKNINFTTEMIKKLQFKLSFSQLFKPFRIEGSYRNATYLKYMEKNSNKYQVTALIIDLSKNW